MTTSELNIAIGPDLIEEIRQIKEQNLEILRLMRVARDRRWYNLQDAGERLSRAAWTLRQLCSHGKIRAEKGEDGQWRISADELVRLEQEGVPEAPAAVSQIASAWLVSSAPGKDAGIASSFPPVSWPIHRLIVCSGTAFIAQSEAKECRSTW